MPENSSTKERMMSQRDQLIHMLQRLPNDEPNRPQRPTVELEKDAVGYPEQPENNKTSPDPLINRGAGAAWSRAKKVWVISLLVVGILVIAVAVTIPLVLTRYQHRHKHAPIPPGPPKGHSYKCITSSQGHECVVDDTNGTCANSNCCQFNCNKDQCLPSCSGTYKTALDCLIKCGGFIGDTFFACEGVNQCVPTTEGVTFPNDPCCGNCGNICGAGNLALVVETISSLPNPNPETYTQFGLMVDAVCLNKTLGSLRASIGLGNSQILLADLTYQTTDKTLAYQTLIELNKTGVDKLYQTLIGNLGQSAGSVDSINFDAQVNVFQQADNWQASDNTLTDRCAPLPVAAVPSTLNVAFCTNGGRYEATTSALSHYPGLASGNVTSVCSGQVPPTALGSTNSLAWAFFGNATSQTVTFAAFDVNALSWQVTSTNPFVHSAPPSSVSQFGKMVAGSADGSVLLVACQDQIILYEIFNPQANFVDWKWSTAGMIDVPTVGNVAVSEDGQVLAWTSRQKPFIYAATKLAGQTGFHHTQFIDFPGFSGSPAFGGLKAVKVSANSYALLASSGDTTTSPTYPTTSANVLLYAIVKFAAD